MRWSRRKEAVESVPLPVPRLDGSTWPPRRRASFGAATIYSLAQHEAFTAEVHDVADVVLDEVLPMLVTGAAAADEAHMQQVCSAATQTGAAIGLVEARTATAGEGTAPDVAAVLWLAADDLPSMPARQQVVARYLLLCGYYLARRGRDQVFEVTESLWQEDHPAVRPGPRPDRGHGSGPGRHAGPDPGEGR